MSTNSSQDDAFPWHLGIFDAHCHPTDTMSSIETIQQMKARVLTVMATRAEDQDLVTSTADKHGVKSSDPEKWSREECIVPCFGWHPWFAHQMYTDDNEDGGVNGDRLVGDAKLLHYQRVLQPSRPDPLSDEDRQTFISLPDPTSFATFLQQTRRLLQQYPYALIGETGLDRSFRIPEAWNAHLDLWSRRDSSLTLGGREGRRLTPFRCGPQHQKKIFKMQLQLAAEMGRAVSVHGVQAHGLVLETLSELWKGHEKEVLSKRERKKRGQDHASVEAEMDSGGSKENEKPKPYPPRICLHSYSGNASNFKQYLNPTIPVRVFASFSTAINLSDAMDEETPASFEEMIKTVPDHMLLVESDLHTAGDEMDRRLEDIVRRICRIKEWGLEEGVLKLGQNWRAFAFGEG
ncbi:Metallo-dependent hydrolase [Cucurbitaria berberidis CBS 394.84]|uniref:Metallo-dependent hydrolase n=1 Tax=Cucurbitaria berberidis CBS 394.84 TaxID=1168544 RepID=A0A9P4GQ90_9PLEO|nr:Metallo-dependent hydrolase [Cucurbitaria berberidis CBS 394.84]KAF1850633.1 Metallo-dependent hydrolase [Cucurbitaria berberidis CBS 394.84]